LGFRSREVAFLSESTDVALEARSGFLLGGWLGTNSWGPTESLLSLGGLPRGLAALASVVGSPCFSTTRLRAALRLEKHTTSPKRIHLWRRALVALSARRPTTSTRASFRVERPEPIQAYQGLGQGLHPNDEAHGGFHIPLRSGPKAVPEDIGGRSDLMQQTHVVERLSESSSIVPGGLKN